MGIVRKVFDRKGVPILAGVFVILFLGETVRQLRRRVQPRTKRAVINSVVSLPAFSLLRLLLLPVMVKLAATNKQKKQTAASQLFAFLFMDATNYAWHILNHRLPFLWRFHLVHHTDRDLDITTAFRFHFGEMIGSVLFRGACAKLSGATPVTVLVYEIAFEAATQFHHSNLRLPIETERLINYFFVTPRMHGIHHSTIRNETDSNYSVIFSFWDRLFRTLRLNVPQDEIVIGVPGYDHPGELTIGHLLKLPFGKIKDWDPERMVREQAGLNDKSVLLA